jgi:integrase
MSGKWSWSNAEVPAIMDACEGSEAVRNRAIIGPGAFWGYRISELLTLRVKDVVDEHGHPRPFITVPSGRLKGGKSPKPGTTGAKPKPADHGECCHCPVCMPKPRHRQTPDDRSVPMGTAWPFIRAQLERLSMTRGGLSPERYIYESRKRDAHSHSKPISRQQAWYALRLAMKRAGLDGSHFGTHSLRKTSVAHMMERTNRFVVFWDGLGQRSSTTTNHYLKSDYGDRLAIEAAMGELLLGAAA